MRKLCCFVAAVMLLLSMTGCTTIFHDCDAAGKVIYDYKEVRFEEDLTAEEVAAVVAILNGKKQESALFSGTPSCGFDRDIAPIIDGTRYALACDRCGALQNCDTLTYIHISDAERKIIEEIFTSRGGTFPCI